MTILNHTLYQYSRFYFTHSRFGETNNDRKRDAETVELSVPRTKIKAAAAPKFAFNATEEKKEDISPAPAFRWVAKIPLKICYLFIEMVLLYPRRGLIKVALERLRPPKLLLTLCLLSWYDGFKRLWLCISNVFIHLSNVFSLFIHLSNDGSYLFILVMLVLSLFILMVLFYSVVSTNHPSQASSAAVPKGLPEFRRDCTALNKVCGICRCSVAMTLLRRFSRCFILANKVELYVQFSKWPFGIIPRGSFSYKPALTCKFSKRVKKAWRHNSGKT